MHDGHDHHHRDHPPDFFHGVIPILYVSDFQRSMDYYVNKLGFEKKWDWGEPKSFGCVKRNNVEIFLCRGGQGRPGTWMSIFLDDVDMLHREYVERGANIIQPPMNFSWGVREFLVQDPDEHVLRMGGTPTGPADPKEEETDHFR